MRRSSRGFTLIELLIVMVVAAILLAVAIPGYQAQARKSRRTEAVTALSDMALRQERWRADHATYGTLAEIQHAAAGTHYTYAVTVNTATNFTLTATGTGPQASDTGCTTLTYAFTGADGRVTKTPAQCWR